MRVAVESVCLRPPFRILLLLPLLPPHILEVLIIIIIMIVKMMLMMTRTMITKFADDDDTNMDNNNNDKSYCSLIRILMIQTRVAIIAIVMTPIIITLITERMTILMKSVTINDNTNNNNKSTYMSWAEDRGVTDRRLTDDRRETDRRLTDDRGVTDRRADRRPTRD